MSATVTHNGCSKSYNCYRSPGHSGRCGRINKSIPPRIAGLPPITSLPIMPSPLSAMREAFERRAQFNEHHDTIIAVGAGAPGTIGHVRKAIELSLSQFLVRGNPTRANIEDVIRNVWEVTHPSGVGPLNVSVHPYRDGYRAVALVPEPLWSVVAIVDLPGEVLKCLAHARPACPVCDEHNRDRIVQRVASGHRTAARIAEMRRASVVVTTCEAPRPGFWSGVLDRVGKVLGL